MSEQVNNKINLLNSITAFLRHSILQEDVEELLKEFHLISLIPQHLYKYRVCGDRAFKALDDNQLFLCKASKLDDQFEGAVSTYLYDILCRYVFSDIMNEPDTKQFIEEYVDFFNNSPEKTGICSLSANSSSQVMWSMYAGDYSGFCIEYDISSCINPYGIVLFPVLYAENRSINVPELLWELRGKYGDDQVFTHRFAQMRRMLMLLCTKNQEWAFQNEWRIIGEVNSVMDAPPISRIMVGSRISKNNLTILLDIARRRGFPVFVQKNNFSSMSIFYEPYEEC